MQKDIFKGRLASEICAEHSHPGYPEKDNVESSLHDSKWISFLTENVSLMWTALHYTCMQYLLQQYQGQSIQKQREEVVRKKTKYLKRPHPV
jgi:hypothetical protein